LFKVSSATYEKKAEELAEKIISEP